MTVVLGFILPLEFAFKLFLVLSYFWFYKDAFKCRARGSRDTDAVLWRFIDFKQTNVLEDGVLFAFNIFIFLGVYFICQYDENIALCCSGNNRKRYADSSGIVFDVNSHSGKELRQFKLCGIELILSVLGNDNLVNKVCVLNYCMNSLHLLGICF